jgi:hypothetical protein
LKYPPYVNYIFFASGVVRSHYPTDSYYHYTTRYSAQLIKSSGKILMAREHDHYGPGVYFTKWSVKNGHTKAEIARNNFRAGEWQIDVNA